jgi:hypothetical protein
MEIIKGRLPRGRDRTSDFEFMIQGPMLSKIHLPPLLPYPLQMTGVVEKITDPGAITMIEAVDGCRILDDVQR